MNTRLLPPLHQALLVIWVIATSAVSARGGSLPIVDQVPRQPFGAQVHRLIEATDYLGTPLTDKAKEKIRKALEASDNPSAIQKAQEILDQFCLVGVTISPESRVKVRAGPATPELVEQGWRQFLVKVHNQAGVTAPLKANSPNARRLAGSPSDQLQARWLDLRMSNERPLPSSLTGLVVEYRILQLYSRNAGKRQAELRFNVGQGTQDIGFRNQVDILFNCLPSTEVTFRVLDDHGAPTTAAFEIRDPAGRVYPSQAKRLAPDFAFHPQIYRANGESIKLPPGTYDVKYQRGPESIPQEKSLTVKNDPMEAEFQIKRWIDPSQLNWWSGDHHIHAAGCAHYRKPTQGVEPPIMARHCRGEDLKIGANLTWGPCFDYQKQFFTGSPHPVSQAPFLLRYDIEVSGFGSHRSGHLCLLRLKEQIYPGGDSKHHWPTLCLNTLKWAQKQGALVGPAHSGWGLAVDSDKLPNYKIPPYDGIGANEYIVDVTHHVEGPTGKPVPAVDFMSAVDTPYVWELNMWYHTLNAGFRTRLSGETDFPCIYGERVGLGRSYVKVEKPLTYGAWCDGIERGACYVGDGRSHLLDFQVDQTRLGTDASEVHLDEPGKVRVTATVAARLDPNPNPEIASRPYTEKPYWHIERARIGKTRQVPVEIVVNGDPVAREPITADGSKHPVSFEVPIQHSSWLALRILPSSHTNPIFVLVNDQPIRASRRSAKWCLDGVDQCWSQKKRFIDEDEMADAKAAYAHARKVYRKRINQSVAD